MKQKNKRNGINKRFDFGEWAMEKAKWDRAIANALRPYAASFVRPLNLTGAR